MNPLQPFAPVPPGDFLDEVLQRRGWSQRDFASVLGRPVQAVNEIIAAKKAITPETAIALSEALGTSPNYWLELEGRYRLDFLHSKKNPKQESKVHRRAKLFSKAPVNELIKRKWIDANLADLDQTERAVCDFLKIKSLDEEPEGFTPRKAASEEPLTAAQIAWGWRVRNVAKGMKSARYSRDRLLALVKELPSWSRSDADTKKVPSALASIGVRLVFVEHLGGTRIDGGALWLSDEAPVVAVSFRYDRVDWFWFTLLHELAHIVAGERSLDQQLVGNDAQRSLLEHEERANKQATEWLIPHDQIQSFVRSVKPYFSRSSILNFAGTTKIHPGIVVGQLQKHGDIPYSHHRNLLTRVHHLFLESEVDAGRDRPGRR
jgi:HTH-type transcriptional regulator/antitoxin HigA